MEVKPIGDKKRAFELSPIVKISLTLYFATSPEGGSEGVQLQIFRMRKQRKISYLTEVGKGKFCRKQLTLNLQ